MLFLWSREPVPAAVGASPRAGPWFAWFATAVLLWRCRRRITRAVFGATAPLRLLKRKRGSGISTSLVVSKAHHHHHHQPKTFKQQQSPVAVQQQQQPRHHNHRKHIETLPNAPDTPEEHQCSRHLKHHQSSSSSASSNSSPSEQQKPQAQRREVNTVAKSRLRRLHAGDGPHMNVGRKLAMSASCYQISQQLYCRMTRSGCVYGRYPTKSSVK